MTQVKQHNFRVRLLLCTSNYFKMNSLEVKRIRKKLGKSQKEFAKMLGVGDRAVQTWESGERNISTSAELLLEMILKDSEQSAGSQNDLALSETKEDPQSLDLIQEFAKQVLESDEYTKDRKKLIEMISSNFTTIISNQNKIRKLEKQIEILTNSTQSHGKQTA